MELEVENERGFINSCAYWADGKCDFCPNIGTITTYSDAGVIDEGGDSISVCLECIMKCVERPAEAYDG